MPKQAEKESLVELIIPNKPEYLRVVRLMVSGYVSRWPLSFDEVENVKVAVTEACNNAIQFAYEDGAEQQLRIKCWREADNLFFEVRDSGKGLGMTETASPDDIDDEKGLGFLLISTLMDDVKIESDPAAGTTVTMSKKLLNI